MLREAEARPECVRLMTHPGVGPVVSLAFVVTLGPAERFAGARQVGSYFGLIPREHSSGGKQRLGSISKQGNSFLRYLLVQGGTQRGAPGPGAQTFLRPLQAYPRNTRGWRRWQWPASWRCVCTGCCVTVSDYAELMQSPALACRRARVMAWSKVDRTLEWAACLPAAEGGEIEAVIMVQPPRKGTGRPA